MKKILVCASYDSLVHSIHMSMPDCYPSGFSKFMADSMLKDGSARIEDLIVVVDKQQTIESK